MRGSENQVRPDQIEGAVREEEASGGGIEADPLAGAGPVRHRERGEVDGAATGGLERKRAAAVHPASATGNGS